MKNAVPSPSPLQLDGTPEFRRIRKLIQTTEDVVPLIQEEKRVSYFEGRRDGMKDGLLMESLEGPVGR